MSPRFSSGGVASPISEALDLLAVLFESRRFLERQAVWTPLVGEVGAEEGRLLDELAP